MLRDILKRIDDYKERIDALRPFEEPMLSQLRAYYRIGLTWSSNALEGSSLTESETKVLLEDGLTVGGKPIRDYYEATGHAKAYDALFSMLDRGKAITEAQVLELHRLFYLQIDDAQAGQYRTEQVYITGSQYPVPRPALIAEDMKSLIAWLAKNERGMHPAVLAAEAHKRFVFIHPFIDGNGRVARLLMNLCLLRSGYTLAMVPPILRGEYISLLEKAHHDAVHFQIFIAERVLETQKDIIRMTG